MAASASDDDVVSIVGLRLAHCECPKVRTCFLVQRFNRVMNSRDERWVVAGDNVER